jgi:DNA polymerase III gamma/tau subunit
MKCIITTSDPSFENAPKIINTFLKDRVGNYAIEYIQPEKEKNKTKEEYSIAQIKNINSKFFRKNTTPNQEKLLVLTSGNKIPHISQNAFLKTLEESIGSIIILTDSLESLLQTIRSRCEVYNSEEITKDNNFKDDTEISLENLSVLAKLDREKLKEILQNKSKSMRDYNLVIKYDAAIKKITANCKTEAVLLELLSKAI